MPELQKDDSTLRETVLNGFRRILGDPLPVYARRKDVPKLIGRGEASLAKDASERAGRRGEILPDAMPGGQAMYLVDKLISYAMNAASYTKGRRPGAAAIKEHTRKKRAVA